VRPRALLLLCCAALVALAAGCRREHFTPEDAWWLSLLDQPQQRGRRHFCLSDRDPSRRARRGEATYCLTSYSEGEAVYRRDAAGTLVRGWRTLGTFEDARWRVMRDSVEQAVAPLVAGAPKCRDNDAQDRSRIMSWQVQSYAVAVVIYEPTGRGAPPFHEITVSLWHTVHPCGDPSEAG
jgi:hypothetical protein